MPDKFAYSTNEETYHGSCASHEEAANECCGGLEEGRRIFTGLCVAPPSPEFYFDIEDLIETVSCQDLYSGEWADDCE